MNTPKNHCKLHWIYLSIFAYLILLQSCANKIKHHTDLGDSEFASNITEINNPIYVAPFQASAEKAWDLVHTELDLTAHFDSLSIDGYATLILKPHFYSQDSLALDAVNMEILEVLTHIDYTLRGTNNSNEFIPPPTQLKFNYQKNKKLVVYFNEIITANQPVSIRIQYSATPGKIKPMSFEKFASGNPAKVVDTEFEPISDDIGMYFINADGKNPTKPTQLWTQGEPQSNCHWFPTLDAPNQKHTQRIRITIPDSMQSLSNGKLTSSIQIQGNNGLHLRTDEWIQSKPHAPYLTMLAVGNWVRVKDSLPWPIDPNLRKRETLSIEYLVEPQFKDDAKRIFGNTPEMIQFFSQYTGVKYPWDKYSQVVVRDFVSGAMENTSATVHMEQLQHDKYDHIDDTYEDYISHELFHQWFGDYVTAENWSDLTLNESFATYGEYLWREFKYGEPNANEWLYSTEKSIYNPSNYNPLLNHHYQNINNQFDGVRYQKGACILHLLRQFIGDDAFRTSMTRYLETFAFKSAEVDDWRQIIEEVTGMDMNPFFNVWYKSNIAKAKLTIGLTTLQPENQDKSSPFNAQYAITASFCGDGKIPFQQYFQPGFKIKVNYSTNNEAHQIDIPLGFCDGEHRIPIGNIQPTHIILDPKIYLPLIQIQYAIPNSIAHPRLVELNEMFLAAEGYSPHSIRDKNNASRDANRSDSYDFNTVPTKPNEPTAAMNLSMEMKRLFWDRLVSIPENLPHLSSGSSEKKSKGQLTYLSPIDRPIMIEVVETLLASNDNSCVLIGIKLLNFLGRQGPENYRLNPQDAFPYSINGELDQPTYNRIRKILLHQSNNPLLESKTQCFLLRHIVNPPSFKEQIILNSTESRPINQGKLTATEAEQLWLMRNTESPMKLNFLTDFLGTTIYSPRNRNEMGMGVFQRDPWQAWTQEMTKAPSPKLRLIWADAIAERILNPETYFDLSGTPETFVINKPNREAEWESFTLTVLKDGRLDVQSAIDFLHENEYNNPILDSSLGPILWENMKKIAEIESPPNRNLQNYENWLTALRWCTRKQYDILITMEKVSADLRAISHSNDVAITSQDYINNGFSATWVRCLKEIHGKIVISKR